MSNGRSTSHRDWVLSVLDEYQDRLLRYARRLLPDPHAAGDVVQQTLLQLCEQRPEQLQGHVAAWLFKVCRTRIVDHWRIQNRMESLSMSDLPCLGREPDPADVAESVDLHTWLSRLLAELPPNQREAIDLWKEGFSYPDVADITGHSVGHVRVLVHRALTRLRLNPQLRLLLELDPAQPLRPSPRSH